MTMGSDTTEEIVVTTVRVFRVPLGATHPRDERGLARGVEPDPMASLVRSRPDDRRARR